MQVMLLLLPVTTVTTTACLCDHHLIFAFVFTFSGILASITCITCFYVLVLTERNGRRQDGTGKLNISIIHNVYL
jgi:hypothetical protein